MATPRRVSSKESEENKRKQNYLRSHGYPNLAVDGSWGPWQEQAWIKATTREKQYPVSPWGLIQRGWDNLTGNTTYRVDHPEGEIRPAPIKNNTSLAGVAAIGLRDPRAAVAAVPLTIGSALWLGNGPEIMQSVSEAGRGLREGAQRVYNKLASYFYPEEAPDPATQGESTTTASDATSADTTATVAPGTTAPSPQPERNDSTSQGRRPSFRERLGDRIAGRSSGQATGNSSRSTPPNNNQNGSFLGRMLWETKNNNFGQNYWQWRNVGRVGLGLSYPAREHFWPAVGSAGKYMIMGPDSIPATPTPATSNTPSVPVDGDYIAKDQYIAPTDTLDF